jgi:uncharacterized protein (TIGR03437 family)
MRFLAAYIPLCAAIAFSQTPCTIRTIAGPASLYSGDGGPAANAYFNNISGFRFDQSGNLYIADAANQRVREVTPNGIVTTISGNGIAGFSGDGGPAISAQLDLPIAVSPDNQGNVYILGSDNRVRKIDSNGIITTIAGNGTANFYGDGGPATQAELQAPLDIIADASGNLYIADTGNLRVRKVDAQGIISTVAGSGIVQSPFIYTALPQQLPGSATAYSFSDPSSLAVDADGSLYIGDPQLNLVFKVDSNGTITNYGLGTGFITPSSLSFDSNGNLAIASPGGFSTGVYQVSPSGAVSQIGSSATFSDVIGFNQTTLYYAYADQIASVESNTLLAGANPFVDSGDGGPATSAHFQFSGPIAVDSKGNVYVADAPAYQVRKIAPDGTITHFAGTNAGQSASGDGGPAAQASLGYTNGIATDAAGNVYLSDAAGLVRKINPQGVISTVLGAQQGLSGAGQFAVDSAGNIYLSTGGGVYEFTSEGQLLNGGNPIEILSAASAWTIDSQGNIYWISVSGLNKLSTDGTVTVTAAQSAYELSSVTGIAADGSGNVYLLNQTSLANYRTIQEVTLSGEVFTLARENPALPYATGAPGQVDLGFAYYLTSDPAGNLYYSDSNFSNVRELTAGCPVVTQPLIAYGGVANAASYDTGTLAPGEIAAVFGSNLGPSTGQVVPVTGGQFPTQYSGVALTVNGYPAPLLYVSQGQTNFVVPFEVSGQQLREIQITYNGVDSDIYYAPGGPADPGIFAIANSDASVNSAANPVQAGSYVVIYGTGQGVSNPPVADGVITGDTLSTPLLPVLAYIDGQPATVLYAGSAPGLVAGVLQINLQLPGQLTGGQHSLNIVSQGWNTLQTDFQTALLFTR